MAPNSPEAVQRKPTIATRPISPVRCLTPLIAFNAVCCWSGGKRFATRLEILSEEIPATPRMRPPMATSARAIGKIAVRAFHAIRTDSLPPLSAMNLWTTCTGKRFFSAATYFKVAHKQPPRLLRLDIQLGYRLLAPGTALATCWPTGAPGTAGSGGGYEHHISPAGKPHNALVEGCQSRPVVTGNCQQMCISHMSVAGDPLAGQI